MLRIREEGMLCYGREQRHRESEDNGRCAKKIWILGLSGQEPQSNQENEVSFHGHSCHHLESNPSCWNAGPGLSWLSGTHQGQFSHNP